jgi:Flp pilus assembly CpaE family ATPase
MSTLVQEIRHFVLREDAVDESPDDIAAEMLRLAQGGFIISLTLRNEAVVLAAPDSDPAALAESIAAAMAPPEAPPEAA